MAMMGIGKMRMRMPYGSMPMRMTVFSLHHNTVIVVMVLVMPMQVVVIDRFMLVVVFVMFGNTNQH
jgi:hypothetical protein